MILKIVDREIYNVRFCGNGLQVILGEKEHENYLIHL